MGKPGLRFKVRRQNALLARKRMVGSAKNADAVVDKRRELKPVRLIRKALRAKNKVNFATLKHAAQFVD